MIDSRSSTTTERAAIWGLGPIGLKTTRYLLECTAVKIVGFDICQDRLQHALQHPALAEAVASGRFVVSASGNAHRYPCTAHFICVNALSSKTGVQDVSAVNNVCQQLIAGLGSAENLVVIRSTLLPGTADEHVGVVLRELTRARSISCDVVVNPSFARESEYEEDLKAATRIVIGASDSAAAHKLCGVYNLRPAQATIVSTTEAELIKYVDNAFHAMKVSFANEVGRVADSVGVDGARVMQAVCADSRLNISRCYLSPGHPYSGACLPKDMAALVAWVERRGVSTPLLEGVASSNEVHASELARTLQRQRVV